MEAQPIYSDDRFGMPSITNETIRANRPLLCTHIAYISRATIEPAATFYVFDGGISIFRTVYLRNKSGR